MTIEAVEKRKQEALAKIEAMEALLTTQDQLVERRLDTYRTVAFDVQTRLEHRAVETSEAEREIAAAWRGLTDARLQRLEDAMRATSETNAALIGLIGELLVLITE